MRTDVYLASSFRLPAKLGGVLLGVQGLPSLVGLPVEAELVEIRHGQKAYGRLQGAVESLRLALGGTVAQAGALTDCPFQGDASTYNSGPLPSNPKLFLAPPTVVAPPILVSPPIMVN
ncbi:Thrombospondin-3a [Liparis tanakae]|uniref:Thrombospondin-3a n=1 Tax=Liparis tanakae TaxID=230148 RepID=A0A4Z2E387_9TELE|nr:Thrombospondin-3a [Liparis tanakae]